MQQRQLPLLPPLNPLSHAVRCLILVTDSNVDRYAATIPSASTNPSPEASNEPKPVRTTRSAPAATDTTTTATKTATALPATTMHTGPFGACPPPPLPGAATQKTWKESKLLASRPRNLFVKEPCSGANRLEAAIKEGHIKEQSDEKDSLSGRWRLLTGAAGASSPPATTSNTHNIVPICIELEHGGIFYQDSFSFNVEEADSIRPFALQLCQDESLPGFMVDLIGADMGRQIKEFNQLAEVDLGNRAVRIKLELNIGNNVLVDSFLWPHAEPASAVAPFASKLAFELGLGGGWPTAIEHSIHEKLLADRKLAVHGYDSAMAMVASTPGSSRSHSRNHNSRGRGRVSGGGGGGGGGSSTGMVIMDTDEQEEERLRQTVTPTDAETCFRGCNDLEGAGWSPQIFTLPPSERAYYRAEVAASRQIAVEHAKDQAQGGVSRRSRRAKNRPAVSYVNADIDNDDDDDDDDDAADDSISDNRTTPAGKDEDAADEEKATVAASGQGSNAENAESTKTALAVSTAAAIAATRAAADDAAGKANAVEAAAAERAGYPASKAVYKPVQLPVKVIDRKPQVSNYDAVIEMKARCTTGVHLVRLLYVLPTQHRRCCMHRSALYLAESNFIDLTFINWLVSVIY